MAKKVLAGGNRHVKRSWWRTPLATVFVAVAAVALVGAVVTRYIERNILNTNSFLAIVGPLPENPKVADALAKFTTAKIFDATDAAANIKEFLPPRLAPLAGTLAEALEKRIDQRAKEFIQSDTFSSIWTTANRAMQKSILRIAENEAGQGKLAAAGSLDLSRLVNSVSQRVGGEATITSAQQAKAATMRLNLKQRVERLRSNVRIIKAGAYMLPYVAIAFLAAALAVAYNRRHTIMAIGITVLLLGVIVLLIFKIMSGGILGDIPDPINKSAAEVIYEAFYGDLRGRIVAAMVSGGILTVLALLAGPYAWAKWLRTKFALAKLKNIEPYRWAQRIRHLAAKYERWIGVAGVAATIVWLLALSTLTPATLVVILSLLVTYASLVHLIARPAPARAAA